MTSIFDVFAEFQRRLSSFGPVVLAGGSVRDHLMGREAKDFDVFVLGLSDEPEDIMNALSDLEPVVLLEFHKSEPFLVSTVKWQGAVVQVMTNPARTVGDLMATFDWNVCLFAYDGAFHQLESIENIAQGKELRLQKVTYPLSTLRRGFRFSERFGMVLKRDYVTAIAKQLLKGDIEHNAPSVDV